MRYIIATLSSLVLVFGVIICTEHKRSSINGFDETVYYYAQDEKVFLEQQGNSYIIGIKPAYVEQFSIESLKAFDVDNELNNRLPEGRFYVKIANGGSDRTDRQLIELLRQKEFIDFMYPVLRPVNQSSSILMPTNEILCAPKSDVTSDEVHKILKEIGSQIERDAYYGDFVLRIKADAEKDVFEIANYLYESGTMDYAYPNFIATMK